MPGEKVKSEQTKEFTDFMDKVAEETRVFGSLLFLPLIILVGIAYGARAGIIAGADKTLLMFREWGK
jgi:hypothetical protein